MKEQTVGELVSYANAHPLRPGAPCGTLHDYATYVATDHILLMLVEWSIPHERMMYHASLSHQKGQVVPDVGVLLITLMALEELLGAPAFFAYQENIVHFFWCWEGAGAEPIPKSPAH